jgi:hypothetical protein
MAARRLLIIMLVLLGLSTLAAALVPQRTLNEETTTGTNTRTAPTTPTTPPPETVPPEVEITVGPKKFPLVRAEVDDQFTLLVFSRHPREIAIPEFGLIGFATAETPARFELLTETPGTFGIVFTASGKAVGRIEVSEPSAKKKGGKKGERKARSRARAGSGPA